MVTTRFSETMSGSIRLAGEHIDRELRLELDVAMPGLLHPLTDRTATMRGRVVVAGWADDPAATGTLEVAPLRRRRIRYRLDFTADDGRRLHLDGWKSVRALRVLRSMTTLPATVTDRRGAGVATLLVRFDLTRALGPMLASARVTGSSVPATARELLAPRWRGQPGRLEAWYTTLTDPLTETGVWIHHELVAATDGRSRAPLGVAACRVGRR